MNDEGRALKDNVFKAKIRLKNMREVLVRARASLLPRNYPNQPSSSNQTQPLATAIDASGFARQHSAQFDKHSLSSQLESTKRKKQELTKSLQYAKNLPDGGEKIKKKLVESEEEIIRLTEEVAAASAPAMTNTAWAGDRSQLYGGRMNLCLMRLMKKTNLLG
jgi:hypothetical protein